MLPKHHAILGLIFSVLLFLIFPEVSLLYAILVFLASVTIDFDHYIYFVAKKKNFSLKKAYKWFRMKSFILKKKSKKEIKLHHTGFYIFHGLEIIILLLFAGKFLWSGFNFVAIGAFFHLILDWIEKFSGRTCYPLKISIFLDWAKSRHLKLLE